MFRQDFSCPALLEDPGEPYPYGAVTRSGAPFQTLPVQFPRATGLVRVRSPRDVSVRRVRFACLWIQQTMTHKGRVSPFGDPRINGRSPLPAAYRSVLRPSSPLSAKAFTKCP